MAPMDYDERDLPGPLRAELKGVSARTAHEIGGHLIAAAELVDTDPELAMKHALAARRKGSRLPIIRESVAEIAYAAEDYPSALTEYRTLFRMTGDGNYLPVLADCERAVGKPNAALKTLEQAKGLRLSVAQRVEALLVESGAREDLGQHEEATRLLKAGIDSRLGGRSGQARLRYAYAEAMRRQGDDASARSLLENVVALDEDDELGAQEELDAMDGLLLELDEDDFLEDDPLEIEEIVEDEDFDE
jgi:tetratricopeptide (TPR) repeat protein